MYIIRYSEIGLKGPRARNSMINALVSNIETVLSVHGKAKIRTERGRIFLESSIPDPEIHESLTAIFGIKSFSPAEVQEFDGIEQLTEIVRNKFEDSVNGKTFAVRCRRTGSHNFTSLDVERKAGEKLLEYSSGVNLRNPDVEINIEIREKLAYLYTDVIPGPGGLPIPSQGRFLSLMSGGIDSPVASWYMMKRGALVSPMFFSLAHPVDTVSFLDSASRLLGKWLSGRSVDVFIIDGRKFIEYSVSRKMKYGNVMFKRVLYRIAQEIALKENMNGIITGESLGQVSSQTSSNLEAISFDMKLPVYRPLIGFDKDEISDRARKIGTFPESDPGEFCALFADKPAVNIPKEDLLNEELPDDLIEEMVRTAIRIDSRKLQEYRNSLIAENLRADTVDEGTTVIDMRKRDSYRQGHFPGSVNVQLDKINEFIETLDPDKKVVLYCKLGLQSAYAASLLRDKGFSAYYADEKIIKKIKN